MQIFAPAKFTLMLQDETMNSKRRQEKQKQSEQCCVAPFALRSAEDGLRRLNCWEPCLVAELSKGCDP